MNETQERTAVAVWAAILSIGALALPDQLWPLFACIMAVIGSAGLAMYFYEQRTVYCSRWMWAQSDAAALAVQLERSNTRLAEVLDENQLLRDDAAMVPVPFEMTDAKTSAFEAHTNQALEVISTPIVVGTVADVVPLQRRKGGKS